MKRLLLVCCLAFASYGCEKSPKQIDTKLKVLKPIPEEFYQANRMRFLQTDDIRSELQFSKFDSGDFSSISSYVDQSVNTVMRLYDKVNNLRTHEKYWDNASKSGCIETANFAYDRYMGSLYNHFDGDHTVRKRAESILRYLNHGLEPDPAAKALAESNIDLVLEYEEKLEENYNANLQAN